MQDQTRNLHKVQLPTLSHFKVMQAKGKRCKTVSNGKKRSRKAKINQRQLDKLQRKLLKIRNVRIRAQRSTFTTLSSPLKSKMFKMSQWP